LASGLRGSKGLFLVVVPQAMPVILPPYISLVTGLVQASSLGAVLGVNELLRSAQILIEQTTISRGGSPAYLVYGAILVVYFVLCWTISAFGARLERHFAKPYQRDRLSVEPRRDPASRPATDCPGCKDIGEGERGVNLCHPCSSRIDPRYLWRSCFKDEGGDRKYRFGQLIGSKQPFNVNTLRRTPPLCGPSNCP
jgi:hypothetical protein